jgi:ABC-type antimicrobial peptide transport system, ATPase component
MQISEYKTLFNKKRGELGYLTAQQTMLNERLLNVQDKAEYILEAQKLLQDTAKNTQNRLSFHISGFITSALQSIWGEQAYTFSLEFIDKRNKTEVQMILHTEQGDIMLDNLNDIRSGGGVLDIVALGLRIALWSLQANHQHVMVLDQPLSNLDSTYLPKAGQLITELSEKLDIQFLMINHNPALADIATKTFEVVKYGNISKII